MTKTLGGVFLLVLLQEECHPEPTDLDNDGWTIQEGDCNNVLDSVNPGAAEVCINGYDDDCNGQVDDCLCAGADAIIWYKDADGDGHGNPHNTGVSCGGQPTHYVANATDCNDSLASAHPGAEEVCSNG